MPGCAAVPRGIVGCGRDENGILFATISADANRMRLLAYVKSLEERDRIAMLMESRGIPVFYDKSGRTVLISTIPIFVCIDAQYDDAVALLANGEHEVAEPVDVEAFRRAEGRAQPVVLKGAAVALLAVVLIAALVVALLWP